MRGTIAGLRLKVVGGKNGGIFVDYLEIIKKRPENAKNMEKDSEIQKSPRKINFEQTPISSKAADCK